MKFKTHFASTSYRVQNTHTHRQYSLFNYFSISLKNTKKRSFVFRPHPTQHDNILQCCNSLPSSLTPHRWAHGPWTISFEVRNRQHPGPNDNCSDAHHLKKAIDNTQVPMKTAVIHTIWSMGIDNTQVPMKTAVIHTIWIREQTAPWSQWKLQWYTPFEVGKRHTIGWEEIILSEYLIVHCWCNFDRHFISSEWEFCQDYNQIETQMITLWLWEIWIK
jgi:hypothetical protein